MLTSPSPSPGPRPHPAAASAAESSPIATAIFGRLLLNCVPQGQTARTHTPTPLDGMSLAWVARIRLGPATVTVVLPWASVGPAPPVTSAPLTGPRLPLSS